MRILIVEDEQKLSDNICLLFKKESYEVEQAFNGEEALDRIYEQHFDLLLLDIMMPIMNGIELIKELRKANNAITVLMLSARDQVEDRVQGLDAGADDYLSKPFSNIELLARVRSLLRRHSSQKSTLLSCRELLLNEITKEVSINSQTVTLTAKEYKILELFLHNPDIIFTRLQLSEYLWGEENQARSNNAIDAHLKNLRKKLSTNSSEYIQTIRSIGYIMKSTNV